MLVAAVYLGLSFVEFGPAWLHGPSNHLQAGGVLDIGQAVSFLAQAPWAVAHGVNPLGNSWINWPVGANFLDNTATPLLGLVMAPVTLTTSPVLSLNLLFTLTVWANCLVGYLVIGSFVRNRLAAFIAGLLFGFSPMATAAGSSHIHVLFDLLPPMMFLFLWRLCTGKGRPLWNGIALGTAMAVQLYIFSEPLADCAIVAAVGLVAAAIVHRKTLADRIAPFLRGAVAAVVSFLVIGGYGVYAQLFGPFHVVGAEHPSGFPSLAADLLGPFLPTVDERYSLGFGLTKGTSLMGVYSGKTFLPDAAENGVYIGIPLMVILLAGLVLLWRRPLLRWAAGLALVSFIFSMGPYLRINGHATEIRLPFLVLSHIPLLKSSVPSRFGMVEWFFLALVLAVELAELHRYLADLRRRHPGHLAGDRRGAAIGSAFPAVAVLVVGAIGLGPLVPSWPYQFSAIPMPTLAVGPQLRSVPTGDVLLGYPFPARNSYLMVYQAIEEMRFRLVGGYVIQPGVGSAGGNNTPPASSCQTVLNDYYLTQEQTVTRDPSTLASCAGEMLSWNVNAVLWTDLGASPSAARDFFVALLGPPTTSSSDSAIWLQPQPALRADVADGGTAAAARARGS